MKNAMTLTKLEKLVKAGKVRKLHTSATRGYVSRKSNGIIRGYVGRFGTGFKVLTPRWDTTSYCYVTYYVYA